MDETNKTYASFIKHQNAIIERLHAENMDLRKASREQDNLNLAHQNFDELLRNCYFNALSKGPKHQASERGQMRTYMLISVQ